MTSQKEPIITSITRKPGLEPKAYDWQFIPEEGKIFTDSSSGACH